MSKIRRKGSRRLRTPGRILVLHGPNLNVLGICEPAASSMVREDLGRIKRRLVAAAKKQRITICGLGSRGHDLALQFAMQSG